MAREITEENRRDSAAGITGETLRGRFEQILRELAKLPRVEDLENLYQKAEIKASLSDIGVSDEKAGMLLKNAPMVRNRLTLLRLLSSGAIYTNS